MFGKPPEIYQGFPPPKIHAIQYFIQTSNSGKLPAIQLELQMPG